MMTTYQMKLTECDYEYRIDLDPENPRHEMTLNLWIANMRSIGKNHPATKHVRKWNCNCGVRIVQDCPGDEWTDTIHTHVVCCPYAMPSAMYHATCHMCPNADCVPEFLRNGEKWEPKSIRELGGIRNKLISDAEDDAEALQYAQDAEMRRSSDAKHALRRAVQAVVPKDSDLSGIDLFGLSTYALESILKKLTPTEGVDVEVPVAVEAPAETPVKTDP